MLYLTPRSIGGQAAAVKSVDELSATSPLTRRGQGDIRYSLYRSEDMISWTLKNTSPLLVSPSMGLIRGWEPSVPGSSATLFTQGNGVDARPAGTHLGEGATPG
jgi:hypothetical protein